MAMLTKSVLESPNPASFQVWYTTCPCGIREMNGNTVSRCSSVPLRLLVLLVAS
jgi:hypothetical protein